MLWEIVMRECRCGRLFEPQEEFDVICDDCWHEAMQADDDEEGNHAADTEEGISYERHPHR